MTDNTAPAAQPATVDDSAFYAAILDRLGFIEDGELWPGGSEQNDLADERAQAVLEFLGLVRESTLPRKLLPAVKDTEIERLTGALTNTRAVASDRIADRDKMLRDIMRERDDARAERAALSDLLRGMARRVAEMRPHVWAAEHRLGLIKQLNELVPKQMREIEQLRAELADLRAQQAGMVKFPADWRERLEAQAGRNSESLLVDRLIGVTESWRPATEIAVGDRVKWNSTDDRWDVGDWVEVPKGGGD